MYSFENDEQGRWKEQGSLQQRVLSPLRYLPGCCQLPPTAAAGAAAIPACVRVSSAGSTCLRSIWAAPSSSLLPSWVSDGSRSVERLIFSWVFCEYLSVDWLVMVYVCWWIGWIRKSDSSRCFCSSVWYIIHEVFYSLFPHLWLKIFGSSLPEKNNYFSAAISVLLVNNVNIHSWECHSVIDC